LHHLLSHRCVSVYDAVTGDLRRRKMAHNRGDTRTSQMLWFDESDDPTTAQPCFSEVPPEAIFVFDELFVAVGASSDNVGNEL